MSRSCAGLSLQRQQADHFASTGSRTITQVVEVEEVAIELTLDQSVDDVHVPELKLALADLYQLALSSITLQLDAGSVVVRVLIAGASHVSLREIAESVIAINNSMLATTIGIGVIHSTLPVTASRSVTREEERPCSRGHWCTAAVEVEW